MKIALGSDHAGYHLKEKIKSFLEEKNLEYTDYGTFTEDSCDYPEFAYKVTNAVIADGFDRGILICGTGIGMCMTANKIKGIRAASVYSEETAQLSRLHNDANVLCLGARTTDAENAVQFVNIWLNTSFEGGRHQRRVELISKLTGL